MAINPNFTSAAYLISAVLFIFSLKGLASPTSARLGNTLGMVGMAIAVITTFFVGHIIIIPLIAGAVVLGAIVGTLAAKHVQMTKMPELVALMHSFVGLSAVLIAIAAVFNSAELHTSVQRIELFISAFIGAITFTASVVAFGKLSGKFGSKPVIFKGQHLLNLLLALLMLGFGILFYLQGNQAAFLAMCGVALVLGITLIVPIGGPSRRHPPGYTSAVVGVGMLGDGSTHEQPVSA